jgi:hypothetical protein
MVRTFGLSFRVDSLETISEGAIEQIGCASSLDFLRQFGSESAQTMRVYAVAFASQCEKLGKVLRTNWGLVCGIV